VAGGEGIRRDNEATATARERAKRGFEPFDIADRDRCG
jgi:hypothetical protein